MEGFAREILGDPDRIEFYKVVREYNDLGGIECPETLYVLVRTIKPMKVVETGVASGFSTFFLLKALERNGSGQLWSIDMPNYTDVIASMKPHYKKCIGSDPSGDRIPQGRNSGWLVPPLLRRHWHLISGVSSDTLPVLLDELGVIDLFLHDSEHTTENVSQELEKAWDHMSKGVLLVDDANWNAAFSDFCQAKRASSILLRSRLGIAAKK